MSLDRERILVSAALSQADPALARRLWMQWSPIRPAMDLISPAETQCLTPAWHAAGCPPDPDEGRFRGLGRQASVSTMTALSMAVEAQQHFHAQGIPSALTGGLAISLLADCHARAPLGVPHLLIEPSTMSAALGRPLTIRERVSGSASLGRVHVVWRSPLREAWSSADSQAFTWQGREVITAAPHRAAFDSLTLAALTSRTPDAPIVASILDLATASTLNTFDGAAWAGLLSRSGLRRVIGAATHPYAQALPAPINGLLGSARPGTRWTRAQARSLRSFFVRTRPRSGV
jgi:hypothetical protein